MKGSPEDVEKLKSISIIISPNEILESLLSIFRLHIEVTTKFCSQKLTVEITRH